MIEERDESMLHKYGCTTWGDYNHPPLPYEECDISEMGGFWSMFSSYGFPDSKNVEFRQVYLKEKYIESVHILIYFDRIYMIKVDRIKTSNNKWSDIPKCYRVGCKHDYSSKILNSKSGD
jgi:hypothetical protein